MYSSIPQHLAYVDQSVHQCGLLSAVGTAVLAKIKNTPQESAFFMVGIGVMDWVSMSTQCICYRKKKKTRYGRKNPPLEVGTEISNDEQEWVKNNDNIWILVFKFSWISFGNIFVSLSAYA